VARRRARTVCSVPGCPNLTDAGRCISCAAEAEQRRGSARQRGYGGGHESRFRPGVLARHPTCVLCRQRPSVHADHWPMSRRELVAAHLDPNDPAHGRGLCGPCHSAETARHQPGGWNA
jgi:5-methylcytosine-specific restriction protein A